MEFLPRQFLFGVCTIALAIGLTDAVHGETTPVVVGLARCSDCTRKNVNGVAAFKGLQVAIKCKNDKGEYESKAMGQVEKSGAFSVPLAADLIAVDGELKKDCFAQLHDASSAPCPGQEPSKIVAAQHSHDGKTTFVALAGKVHQPSAECSSAFLCDPLHKHHWFFFHKRLIVPPMHDHDHPHLPVIKPPVTIPPKHDHDHDHDHSHDHNHDHDHEHGHDHDHDHDNDRGHDHDHDHDQDHDHEHDHDNNQDHGHDHDQDHDHHHDHDHDQGHDHDHDHDHDQGHDHDHDHDNDQGHDHDHDHDNGHGHGHGLSLPPVAEPPRTAVYMPMPPKATPIYRPPARRDAVTEPQLFKKMFPFLKKLPFFPSAEQNSKP